MELAIPRWCVASLPGYHPGAGGASVPSPWTIEPALTSRRDDALDALMAAAVAGDARAFEALYRALAPRVRGFLRNLSGDDRAADDLTQTTFLKIHRARASYQLGAPVEPWVFAIARRTFLDHRRSRRRRPEDLSHDGSVPEPAPVEESPDGFDRLDPQVADTLRAGLESLPDAQREAIVLLKVEGLSVADAAQVAGVTPGALKVRAHRGYEALRKLLGVRRTA
ncbi:MAG: RNA polymerase sigma factor [Polyangiales bacterium]